MEIDQVQNFFKWKCFKYLKEKKLDSKQEYIDRLNYELSIISKMNYEAYFLIVADFLDWARQNNIPVGPGRGSVAGSLVAYVLGITTIDPIPYGLYFERFLNPNRISAPDIDCDFCINRREDVLQYVINKYGADKVAPIGTFSKMHGKGVVRSTMKAFGIPYSDIDHIAKLIPEAQQGIAASLEKAYSIEGTGEELKFNREQDNLIGQSLKIAERLEDLTKSASTHACFSYDMRILTDNGYQTIGSLENQIINIVTSNGIRPAKIISNGIKTVSKIQYGNSIKDSHPTYIYATSDHQILDNNNNWTELEKLIDSKLGTRNVQIDSLSILAGWFWNDGNYIKPSSVGQIYFTPDKDIEAIKLFDSYINSLQREDRYSLSTKTIQAIQNRFSDNFKYRTYNKKPPIFQNIEDMIGWLRGFFSANACIQRGTIRLKLTSKELLSNIVSSLKILDIFCSKPSLCKGKLIQFDNGEYQCKDSWQIEIAIKSAYKFKTLIGFIQNYKQESIKNLKLLRKVDESTEKVFDFQVLSDKEEDRNGYIEGILCHNCGVIIADQELMSHIPLQRPPRKGNIPISQFEMRDIEWLGFIKFDFLGLKTLTLIQSTIDAIKENYNISIDLESIDYNDQTVLDFLINEDDLEGIFQLDSDGIRAAFKETKPCSIDEWSDLIALYRPGPIQFLESYNNQKFGRSNNELIFEELAPIYNYTHGVLIYQEQIMRIATDIAGYTLPEADELRKVVGKKLPDEMVKHEDRFINGCVNNGFNKEKAKELWDAIQKFAHYGFNKSHSIAYAKIGYQTGWLKKYYTAEFLASHLSLLEDNISIGRALRSAKHLGIVTTPPNIHNTALTFKALNNKITFSVKSVKHVGTNDIKALSKSNKKFKTYTNLYDWLLKTTFYGINLRAIKALAQIGALDNFEYNRATVINNIESLHDAAKKTVNRSKQKGWIPWDLDDKETDRYINKVTIQQYPDLSLAEKIKFECEYIGTCISGEPKDMVPYLNKITDIIEINKIPDEGMVKIFGIITYKKEFATKRKEQMARITIYDGNNEIGLVLFPKLYKTLRQSLEMYIPVIVTGNIKTNDKNKEVLVSNIDICDDQLYNKLLGVYKIQINVGCLVIEGITKLPIEQIIKVKNSIDKSNIDFLILD